MIYITLYMITTKIGQTINIYIYIYINSLFIIYIYIK